MGLVKNDIPILEYDNNPAAVISANRENLYSFPKRAVFPFLADEVENYATRSACEKIGEFVSVTKIYPIYRVLYEGEEICLCQAPVGAAAATQILDYLIGYGAEKIISTGTCGTLVDFAENEFLIPVEALRCEGTSYHYLPAQRTVKINKQAISAIEKALTENNMPFTHCKTWTTDGFYRETKEMVNYRKEEGFHVVEMECSALTACAEFRNVLFGQILFTADTLANADAHDSRNWGYDSFPIALQLCFDAVVRL